MVEAIEQFFLDAFNQNAFWAIFVVAMFPLIELKGAIIFGQVLRAHINLFEIFLASYLGSLAVMPFLIICVRPIINWLKRTKLFCKIANRLETRLKRQSKQHAAENTTEMVLYKEKSTGRENENPEDFKKPNKKKDFKKILFVVILVGIPIPGTGVWTGATAAVFMGLSFFKSFISTAIGNLISAGILILITELFGNYIDWILYSFLIIAVMALLVFIYEVFIKKNKKNQLQDGIK